MSVATLTPAQRKTIDSFFVNYPYRKYQDRWTNVDRQAMGKFHSEKFLQEPHGLTLTQKEWVAVFSEVGKTVKNSEDIVGLGSFKSFGLLSQLLGKEAYMLKDFLVTSEIVSPADKVKSLADFSGQKASLYTEQIYTALWQKLENELKKDKALGFVGGRIPTENIAAINVLLQNGFDYIANETIHTLILERPGEIPKVLAADLARADEMYLSEPQISFRLARADDYPALMKLVKHTPFPTRYRLDKRFSPELVSQIYQETLLQSLKLENHYICLCEIKAGRKHNLVGFISFIINQQFTEKLETGWGSLDFIAIDPEYRQNGMATVLNAWAIQFLACSGVSMIQVKTLAQNYPSTALLTRSGFKLTANNVLLHWIA